MRIFEHPYIAIAVFVLGAFIFGGIVICLASRGLKTPSDEDQNRFARISKMESRFIRSGRLRENRCVMYISVFLDNYRSLYSDERTEKIYAAIRQILLQSFMPRKNGMISTYGEYAYVAYSTLCMEEIRSVVEDFQAALNKCLIDSSALNIVEVKVGAYFALGSEITLDEAIYRAKRACVLAKHSKQPYAEWDAHSGKELENKIKIENNIENEIDNNRFFLVYQPIVAAKTGEIMGAEVLARLKSVSEGVLQPGKFLSAVDSVGLNHKFDYYIFEKHCKWISEDKEHREGYIYTINFSRSTLCELEFVKKILGIVEKYELKSSYLAI